MDGEELGRRIAADPQLKDTALVLMTGFGRHSDLARLQALGFSGHVIKPIWERTLREALLALRAKGNGTVAPGKPVAQPPSTVRAKRQARILLAEDNLTNQEVAVAMLKKLGYRADLVANGAAALEALRKADYDVVLMDCEMPEMDGYEATKRIREPRAGTRNPRIPIIAVTADAMTGDRDRCLQAGMSDYIAKPVELRILADVLEKWLNPPANAGEMNPPAGHVARKHGSRFQPNCFQPGCFQSGRSARSSHGRPRPCQQGHCRVPGRCPAPVAHPEENAGGGRCRRGAAAGACPQRSGGYDVGRGPASALLRSAGRGGSDGVEPRLGSAATPGRTIRTAQDHPEAVRVV